MGASYRIHEDVAVDENQVVATPRPRDSPMTRKCSLQSGSVSGPSSSAHDLKNSLTSSGDSNSLTLWRVRHYEGRSWPGHQEQRGWARRGIRHRLATVTRPMGWEGEPDYRFRTNLRCEGS